MEAFFLLGVFSQTHYPALKASLFVRFHVRTSGDLLENYVKVPYNQLEINISFLRCKDLGSFIWSPGENPTSEWRNRLKCKISLVSPF
jgi:hypothetical protein